MTASFKEFLVGIGQPVLGVSCQETIIRHEEATGVVGKKHATIFKVSKPKWPNIHRRVTASIRSRLIDSVSA
jgi:hypothetical protein